MRMLKFHRCNEPAEHSTRPRQPHLGLERSEFPSHKVGRVADDSVKNGCPQL